MKIDIIGDIHGCYAEFVQLTKELGYNWDCGIPIHPNRILGFVGDLTDRGAHSLAVISVVSKLVTNERAVYAPGNHCNKLYRYFLGRNVTIANGLETTVAELDARSLQDRNDYKRMFMELYETSPLYHMLDDGKLIIAHAGLREDFIGKNNKKIKTFVLYGDITGEVHSDGRPVRRDWAKNYNGEPFIVYGHTPVKEPRTVKNTINIDTGAVFGGMLTAFRYPERETVSVKSSMPYVQEKFRSFS